MRGGCVVLRIGRQKDKLINGLSKVVNTNKAIGRAVINTFNSRFEHVEAVNEGTGKKDDLGEVLSMLLIWIAIFCAGAVPVFLIFLALGKIYPFFWEALAVGLVLAVIAGLIAQWVSIKMLVKKRDVLFKRF